MEAHVYNPLCSLKQKETKTKKKVDKSNFSDENPFQSESESERRRSRSRDTFSRSRSVTRSQSRSRLPRNTDKEMETTPVKDHVFKVPAQPAFSRFMQPPASKIKDSGSASSSVAHSTPRRMSVSELPEPKPLHLSSSESRRTGFNRNNLQHYIGPALAALSAILLSYGVWYRQTRIEVGFCTPTTAEKSTGKQNFDVSFSIVSKRNGYLTF